MLQLALSFGRTCAAGDKNLLTCHFWTDSSGSAQRDAWPTAARMKANAGRGVIERRLMLAPSASRQVACRSQAKTSPRTTHWDSAQPVGRGDRDLQRSGSGLQRCRVWPRKPNDCSLSQFSAGRLGEPPPLPAPSARCPHRPPKPIPLRCPSVSAPVALCYSICRMGTTMVTFLLRMERRGGRATGSAFLPKYENLPLDSRR